MTTQIQRADAEEIFYADTDASHQYGRILHTGRYQCTVFVHTILEGGCDFGDDVGQVHGKRTVDDNHLRIKYVQQVIDADGHIFDKLIQHFECIEILIDTFCTFRDILFQTAFISARTGTTICDNDRMTEFTGISVKAGIQFVFNDDTDTDTGMDTDTDHIGKVMAEDFFADDGKVGLIFKKNGYMKQHKCFRVM